MKDYWSKLPFNKRGKNERFNFIMDHIEEVSSNTPKTSETEQGNSGSDEPKTDTPVTDEPVVDDPVIDEPEPTVTYDISVTVLDNENNPISGASVTEKKKKKEYTGNTGSAGGCNIRNVPLGDYSVTTIKDEYIISEDDITVVAGENTLEIILEKEKATYSEDTETFDEEGGL